MSSALQAAFIVGAWILVVLLLVIGFWFLRRHQLLHTALLIIAGLVGVFLLIRLTELIIMLVIAGVVAFILDGLVERLTRVMPRALAIATVYVGLVVLLTLAGVLVIPLIVKQARLLVQQLPMYTDQAKRLAARLTTLYGGSPEQVQTAIDNAIENLQGASRAATSQVEHALLGILGWTVKGLLSLVMSIYLLTDKQTITQWFIHLFPADYRDEASQTLGELSLTFSRYLRGQLTVILFVMTAVTVTLLGFGIHYAVFIGFIAGVLEVIPYFGAIGGALPAVTLGFMEKSTGVGVALIIIFILINQIEGHVVIPLVMGRNLEVRPLTILLALIAGERLYGVVGMIVAVPLVSMLRVLIPRAVAEYRRLRTRERGILSPGATVEARAAPIAGSVER